MTRQPRISIGLPVYNGKQFIAPAIESLLGQTLGDFELIICDNASTDETEAICRRFALADPRIRYHRNATNIGAGPNFNRVFTFATAPYFKWAAHDDLYAPTYLARCAEVLDTDPSAVLCHSRTVVIDEHGQQVVPPHRTDAGEPGVRWEDLYEMPRRLDSDRPHERFEKVLLETRRCFEIFGLARIDAMARTGLHGNYYGSDKVILSSLSLVGRLVEIPEPLFFRRHHEGTSGSILSASAREKWMNPKRGGRAVFPRMSCLRGYCRSVLEAHLGWRERAGCFGAVARYLMQPNRWAAVLREPW